MPRKCIAKGCSTVCNFGYKGEVAQWCSRHGPLEAIDLNNIKCPVDGCNKNPSFGLPGKRAIWCQAHASPEAVNVRGKRCIEPGCNKFPFLGYPGNPRKWCTQHAPSDAVDTVHKMCDFSGCRIRPHFGFTGECAKWCRKHAPLDAKNTKKNVCGVDGCSTQRTFGLPGESALWCRKHAPKEAFSVNKICSVPGCVTRAYFAKPGMPASVCAAHRQSGDVNVNHYRCKTCALFTIQKKGDECWTCRMGASRMKQKEVSVKSALEAADMRWSSYDSRMPCVKSKARPDFVFAVNPEDHVILEVDEHAHKHGSYTCELSRLQELRGQFPGRLIVLRYNPDYAWVRAGKRKRDASTDSEKHAYLIDSLRRTCETMSVDAFEEKREVAGMWVAYLGYKTSDVEALHAEWLEAQKAMYEESVSC